MTAQADCALLSPISSLLYKSTLQSCCYQHSIGQVELELNRTVKGSQCTEKGPIRDTIFLFMLVCSAQGTPPGFCNGVEQSNVSSLLV